MNALVAAMVKGSGGLKGFNSEIMEAFNAAQVDLMGAMEKRPACPAMPSRRN